VADAAGRYAWLPPKLAFWQLASFVTEGKGMSIEGDEVPPKRKGSLVVVGTGISVGQVTIEARAYMEQAEKLLYLVADPATSYWVRSLNATAESLHRFYSEAKPRIQTYLEMIDRILELVREGRQVCAAFYGHPGVFVFPSHEAIHRAREEGFVAKMLPGVSADACMYADLGFDPGTAGCQSYEATEFLLHPKTIDVNTPLILWQISVVGELGYRTDRLYNPEGLKVLSVELVKLYGPNHEVIIYVASPYVVCDPEIKVVSLAELANAQLSSVATLFVPPLGARQADLDMATQLGINIDPTT
jgi:Tetrapyrrole (Corrin/Porphyrin) Methylases